MSLIARSTSYKVTSHTKNIDSVGLLVIVIQLLNKNTT